MELFGFEILKKPEPRTSFVEPEYDDGAMVVSPGGVFGTVVDFDGLAKSDADLVTKYRNMYNQPECQTCVDEIVNEAIVKEDSETVIELVLDKLSAPERVKEAIRKEWEDITDLFNLNNDAYQMFQRWFVDGRINYHIIVDEKNPKEGIKELRFVDPRKLRKVRVVQRKREGKIYVNSKVEEFYIFNDRGFKATDPMMQTTTQSNQGIKIAADSIIFVPSGLNDPNNKLILGYLHKAIRPLNQLRMLEDSVVIYRISRAPERRIFYIDVGRLPPMKAEQHLREMAAKHKNRVIYDQETGSIRDDRKYQTMLEDYWFPTREGRATKVETLPAGQNLGQMDDVTYFKKKLFEALDIPTSRLESGGGAFTLGKATEVSRDELKFQKFINRLRTQFSKVLLEALGKQLVLKGVITVEDWDDFKNKIFFEFSRDNYFAELKEAEILTERVALLGQVDQFQGKYYSKEWIWETVLKMSEEEIKKMKEQMEKEAAEGEPSSYEQFGALGADPSIDPNTGAPEDIGNESDAEQDAQLPDSGSSR